MALSSLASLKIKAKLLQKAKRRTQPDYPLKDAYQALAKSAGYSSWNQMKTSYELADVFNPPHWSAQWKIWFSQKEEALSHLSDGHYLLPYREQFFLCDQHYLEALGISPLDPDLKSVGQDFTAPKNKEAFRRLMEKIRKSQHVLK